MIRLELDRKSDLPLYRQIAGQLRERIRTGSIPIGDRLPTVRQLAEELHLTRLTVHTAYSELQAEGLVESVVGRGTFVSDRVRPQAIMAERDNITTFDGRIWDTANNRTSTIAQPPPAWLSQGAMSDRMRLAQQPQLLSFAQAIPSPGSYPARELERGFREALEDPTLFSYGPTQGIPVLREQTAHLLLDEGIVTSPDHLIITSGAHQALDLVMRTFTTPDDIVLVEEATYPGFIELASQRKQKLIGVPMDKDGLMVDVLDAICAKHHPRLLYTVPNFQNPMGVLLSQERRLALLAVARAHNLIIIEDDVYGFLSYEALTPPALKASDKDDLVIFVSSFSKILAPGLRLGFMLPPPSKFPALLQAKRGTDLSVSPILQAALANYLRYGYLGPHLQRVRLLYREQRDATLKALQKHMPECSWNRPDGGLSIWVTLPEEICERDFYLEAIERGVGFTPGQAFFPQPQNQNQACMRLSFGGLTLTQIETGVAILGKLLHEQLDRCKFSQCSIVPLV